MITIPNFFNMYRTLVALLRQAQIEGCLPSKWLCIYEIVKLQKERKKNDRKCSIKCGQCREGTTFFLLS